MSPLGQLTTPTVKPPTSLDLLNQDEGQTMQATSLAAPTTTQGTTGTAGALTPPTTSGGLPGPNVSQFASQQMANPSRYNLDVVRQGLDLINQESAESQKRGVADMDEFYSSRGLVGSSVESQGRGDFLSQLERVKSQRQFDLVREMANTFSQDVSTAGQLGLGARAQELQAMGMGADNAYRYAVLEQSGSQFDQSLGQRQSEFGGTLEFQREQLAAELGLSREQLDLQRDQMSAEYGDRQMDRLHQMNLQEGSQEFAATQAGLDRMLEQQALDLQRQGLDAESAWREADRSLQEQLETRALDLQQQGMTLDQAYREAALQIDRDQMAQSGQIANQQAQLSAADIYLRALAAGAGDYGDVAYPNVNLIGGGTTGPGGTGTTPVPGANQGFDNFFDWYNNLPVPQQQPGPGGNTYPNVGTLPPPQSYGYPTNWWSQY